MPKLWLGGDSMFKISNEYFSTQNANIHKRGIYVQVSYVEEQLEIDQALIKAKCS